MKRHFNFKGKIVPPHTWFTVDHPHIQFTGIQREKFSKLLGREKSLARNLANIATKKKDNKDKYNKLIQIDLFGVFNENLGHRKF